MPDRWATEVYTLRFEDGERHATITDWPVKDLVGYVPTSVLLNSRLDLTARAQAELYANHKHKA